MSGPEIGPEIGFGIVGPGKVAHTHARALAELKGARLVAACGRDPERTAAFCAPHGASAYTDLAAMLERPDLHAVILCTPHPRHADEAVAAASAGKHVLVEKPLATTVADCERAIRAAREHRVRLGVVSQRRLYEPAQRVKNAILAGKIGRPILGALSLLGWRGPEYYAMDAWRGTWAEEGGGVLVNQAVHQIDLLLWFMGEVEAVSGFHANLNHPEIEVEDTAVAVLRFKGGALGSLTVSNSQSPGLWGRVHVHGENGASLGVRTDGGSSFVSGVTARVEPPVNDLWTVPGEAHLLEVWRREDTARAARLEVMTHYHRLQLEDFAGAIREGREPLVTGEDGRRAVAVFEAIYAGSGR